MQDFDRLLEIQRRMEEEHRLDREALERLKRFLPLESQNGEAQSRESEQEESSDWDALSEFDELVESIIDGSPGSIFTVAQILMTLETLGKKPNAKRPETAVNRSLNRLVHARRVEQIRAASGRAPGLYKSKRQAEMDMMEEEDDDAVKD